MLILPFLILSYDILHLLHCLLISYSIFCCIVSSHTAIISDTRTLPTFEFWPLQNNSTPHYLFRWCHYLFSYRRKGPRRSRRVRHLSVRTYLINANTDLRLLSLMCYFLFLFPPSLRLLPKQNKMMLFSKKTQMEWWWNRSPHTTPHHTKKYKNRGTFAIFCFFIF